MIKEFSTWLATGTGLVKGDTLQVGFFSQNAPTKCSAIIESGGGEVNGNIPDAMRPVIQIISRAENSIEARTEAWNIYSWLHGKCRHDLPVVESGVEYFLQTADAIAIPQYIGQDEKGLHQFSTNYILKIKNKI